MLAPAAPTLLRSAAFAVLIFLSAPSAVAQPQPQLVESVNVVGNRRLTDAEILKHVKTRPGEPYDHEQVMRDFQTLMNLGFFDRRASRAVTGTGQRGGVEVYFALLELPVIESVQFEGLPADVEWALRVGLRRRGMEVRAGDALDTDKLNAVVRVMERMLRVRGWYNVAVEARTEEASATSLKLTFVVRALPPERRLDRKKSDGLGSQAPVA